MNTIGHWIGGRTVAGTSGRSGPVFNPASGVQAAEVALASAGEVDDAVKAAVAASDEWGASSLGSRTDKLFRLRELISAHRDDLAALITAEHGKVLADARGRGRPRPGVRRVRVRRAAPPEGLEHLRGVVGHRRAHAAAAARRRRRHHAVQLPRHGAALDDGQRDRVRERLRAEAVGEGPVAVAAPRRSRRRAPASPTASSPCSTAMRRRSTRC